MESDGKVMWLSAAKSQDEAESLANQFANKAAGSYMIYDHNSRRQTIVRSSAAQL